MSDNTEEFEPCPFCDNHELDGPHYADNGNNTTAWIECTECEIVMERDTISLLKKSWNQRPQNKVGEALELLKEAEKEPYKYFYSMGFKGFVRELQNLLGGE